MKKKTWIILISFAVLVIAGGSIGVMVLKQKAQQAMAPVDAGMGAATAVVTKGEIKSGIYTSGTVRSADEIQYPYDATKEVTFSVKNGEEVKKGKLLFEVKDPELTLQYEEAKARKNQLSNQVAQLKALPSDAPEKGQLSATQMELKSAQMQVDQIDKRIAANKIMAPFDGVVTLSKDLPAKGDQAQAPSFVRLINPKKLVIAVPIDEIDYPKVKVGDKVNITLAAYENQNFTGVISYLGKEAFNEGGIVAFPASVSLDPSALILPGMTADVSVVIAEKAGILILPTEAVFEGEKGEQYVNISLEDGVMEQRTVKTGISDDTQVEILSGLKEGDQVELQMMEKW